MRTENGGRAALVEVSPSPSRVPSLLPVAVNGRFLTQPVTGVQRYAREVLTALDDLLEEEALPGFHVEVFVPRVPLLDVPPWRHLLITPGGRLRGHAWEQLELPALTRGRLLLGLCNTGPATVRRQVITVHDGAVFDRPEAYSLAFRAWYRTLLRRIARHSLRLITPSVFSREAIVRHCRVAAERVEVIPHGHEHALGTAPDPRVLERHGLGRRPYVLAVSSRSGNKNFATIARALEGLEVDVVVAGGSNERVFTPSAALPETFRLTGYVTDGELRALYEGATCLLYPSLYEGFGFPPLEAMALGCPVVASRAASLPEVCGDAALYCDPHDAAGLAARVREVVADGALRERLREAGRVRAGALTWRASALAHARCLERLVHAG